MEQGQIEDRQVNRDLPHEKPQYLVIATITHLIPGERISIPGTSAGWTCVNLADDRQLGSNQSIRSGKISDFLRSNEWAIN